MSSREYDIAVLKGDGIGPEVVDEALRVLESLQQADGLRFSFREYPAGADCYLAQGTPLPKETLAACREADAVILGAMGNPEIRWEDGTEMRPQVDLRFELDLYAGVRPIYLFADHHSPLKGVAAGDIDFVILRENVEGLFASMNAGIELRGEVAVDTMVMTRSGTERVTRYAYELARQRRSVGGSRTPRVTCVDKANIFRSMAFFRSVFDRVGEEYPDIERDYAYVDAMALYLVRRPQDYDVLVTENMYGDILSDLAAGLVGGMGMAPSADIGEAAAVFQPSHGSAPDIAGQGVSNPVATILSAGLMLRWLGQRHDDAAALEGGSRIDGTVRQVMADPQAGTPDLGGTMATAQLGALIASAVTGGR